LPIVFLFCFFFLVVVVLFAWVKCRKIFPIDWRVIIFFRISVETKKRILGDLYKKTNKWRLSQREREIVIDNSQEKERGETRKMATED